MGIAEFKEVSGSLRLSHVYRYCSQPDNLKADIYKSIKDLQQNFPAGFEVREVEGLLDTLTIYPL